MMCVLSRKARALLVVPLLLVAALSFPSGAAAKTTPWSQPINISGNTNGGWFPAIAVDQSGQVHVVWNGGVAGSAAQAAQVALPNGQTLPSADTSPLFYTHWNGQQWSNPVDIELAKPASIAVRSALAVDRQGKLILFYRGMNVDQSQNNGTTEDLRIATADARQAGDASAWSSGQSLNWRTPNYLPKIGIDARGVIHAFWTEYDGVSGYALYYSRSTDGGLHWSPRSVLEGYRSVYYYRFSLKVGPGQDVRVAYEVVNPAEGVAWAPNPIGFVYAQSKDGGETWSKTSFVPSENVNPRMGRFSSVVAGGHALIPVQPAIGVDGKGQVLLVWRDRFTNVLYYQHSPDGSIWSTPEPLPGVSKGIDRPFDRYEMATDSAGHVHLVFVGYRTGSPTLDLLHSEWDGSHWSDPQVIASSPPYPEYPGIAVAEGNRLQVVWFNGDSIGVNRQAIGIWYSTAEVAAPFVAPVPLPALARASSSTASNSNQEQAVAATPLAEPVAPPYMSKLPPIQPSEIKGYSDRPLLLGVGAVAGLIVLTLAARRTRLLR